MMNHIAVIATGGTIASTQGHNGLTAQLSASDILQSSELSTLYQINVRNLLKKDSSALSFTDLELLQQTVEEELNDTPAGIIVLHGTDTLESTALWLTLTSSARQHNCPVIITGAIYPADHPQTDGPKNLQGAVHCIEQHYNGHPIPGVSVFFANHLWDPWGLTKMHTSQIDAFASPRIYRATNNVPLPLSLPLHPTPHLNSPITAKVPLVAIDLDDSGDNLSAIVHHLAQYSSAPQDAVILCALGSGNLPPAVAQCIQDLQQQYPHLLWLLTTRVPRGSVTPSYAHKGGGAQLIQQGIIFGGYLKAPQLRILIVTLLSAGYQPTQIKDLFANWSEDPIDY